MPNTHIEPTVPSDQDALRAAEARRALQQHHVGYQALRVPDRRRRPRGHDPRFAAVSSRACWMDILKETAAGHAVTLVPFEAEITTQQAAELLNVSRPFVVGMIDKGTLPARMVGTQRRLPLKDVLAYKAENRAKRRETLRELAAHDQKLGLFALE